MQQIAEVKSVNDLTVQHIQDTDNKLNQLYQLVHNLQSQNLLGKTNENGGVSSKGIMEHKVVANLEKLTDNPGDFTIWALRLKNALDQVNVSYGKLLKGIELIPETVVTYEQWRVNYHQALITTSGLTPEAFTKIAQDLYVLMVDKCTNNQVIAFENDDQDSHEFTWILTIDRLV